MNDYLIRLPIHPFVLTIVSERRVSRHRHCFQILMLLFFYFSRGFNFSLLDIFYNLFIHSWNSIIRIDVYPLFASIRLDVRIFDFSPPLTQFSCFFFFYVVGTILAKLSFHEKRDVYITIKRNAAASCCSPVPPRNLTIFSHYCILDQLFW